MRAKRRPFFFFFYFRFRGGRRSRASPRRSEEPLKPRSRTRLKGAP